MRAARSYVQLGFQLVATEGLGQALEIGTQQRPDLFDLDIRKPAPLYRSVIEARERLAAKRITLLGGRRMPG